MDPMPSFILIPGAGGIAWSWHRVVPLLEQAGCEPGETAGAWWGNTGAVKARIAAATAGGYSPQFDLANYFLHDLPEAVLHGGPSRQREQSDSVFDQPCRFERRPGIPIRVIAAVDDRFFPLELRKRVARERLNAEVEVVPGGHLVALSRPEELADRLLRFGRDVLRYPVGVGAPGGEKWTQPFLEPALGPPESGGRRWLSFSLKEGAGREFV